MLLVGADFARDLDAHCILTLRELYVIDMQSGHVTYASLGWWIQPHACVSPALQ